MTDVGTTRYLDSYFPRWPLSFGRGGVCVSTPIENFSGRRRNEIEKHESIDYPVLGFSFLVFVGGGALWIFGLDRKTDADNDSSRRTRTCAEIGADVRVMSTCDEHLLARRAQITSRARRATSRARRASKCKCGDEHLLARRAQITSRARRASKCKCGDEHLLARRAQITSRARRASKCKCGDEHLLARRAQITSRARRASKCGGNACSREEKGETGQRTFRATGYNCSGRIGTSYWKIWRFGIRKCPNEGLFLSMAQTGAAANGLASARSLRRPRLGAPASLLPLATRGPA